MLRIVSPFLTVYIHGIVWTNVWLYLICLFLSLSFSVVCCCCCPHAKIEREILLSCLLSHFFPLCDIFPAKQRALKNSSFLRRQVRAVPGWYRKIHSLNSSHLLWVVGVYIYIYIYIYKHRCLVFSRNHRTSHLYCNYLVCWHFPPQDRHPVNPLEYMI